MTVQVENRTSRRRRVLKGGKVFYNDFYFSIDCVIRNEGADGMMVEVPVDVVLPESIAVLSRKDSSLASARVIWRKGERVGVQLTSEPEDVRKSSHLHIRQMSTMISH